MVLWVLSDLHLGDETVVPMFHEDRQGKSVEALCARIEAERDGELVLLGDVFDLTGMTPPPASVKKFGRKLGVDLDERPVRSAVELCAASRLRHARTLAALADLSTRGKVTLVPGNHDHALGGPDGRAALDAAGLQRVRIEPRVVRTLADRTVVMEHGHASDVENASPGGAGEMLTRVMHQAVVPMLEKLDARPNVQVDPQRLVALRPEERMVPVMQRWLTPKQFDAFVDALLDMLVDVGAMSRLKAWLVTPELLREKLDDADDLWERIGARARRMLAGTEAMLEAKTRPDVLVYGHTHVPDWSIEDERGGQRLYVNLGSWTDRATDAVGPFDDTLPMLRLGDDTRGLRATLEELGSGRTLQSFDAAHSGGAVALGIP